MTQYTIAVLDAISLLEQKGFKVLASLDTSLISAPAHARYFVIADTETIGRDPKSTDTKLIELGLVRYAYDPATLEVYGAVAELSQLKDPGVPIPPETTAVTGITDDMVQGKQLNYTEIATLVEDADFLICHNVSFDQPIIQRELSDLEFHTLYWLCTMRDIDWLQRGLNGTKLEYLCMMSGFHYSAHRASVDCHAVGELLKVNPTMLGELLEKSETKMMQVWAIGADFSVKDVLKNAGFYFDAGTSTTPKAWCIQCPAEDFATLSDWLLENVYFSKSAMVKVRNIDKTNQYSLNLPLPESLRIVKSV